MTVLLMMGLLVSVALRAMIATAPWVFRSPRGLTVAFVVAAILMVTCTAGIALI